MGLSTAEVRQSYAAVEQSEGFRDTDLSNVVLLDKGGSANVYSARYHLYKYFNLHTGIVIIILCVFWSRFNLTPVAVKVAKPDVQHNARIAEIMFCREAAMLRLVHSPDVCSTVISTYGVCTVCMP